MKPTLYPNGFPSAYEELKTFYPVFYRDVFEMDAIWRAAGGGLDEIEDGVDAVVNNNFVSLMDTDTLAQMETFLGIPLNQKRTLEARRKLVALYFIGGNHIGSQEIKDIVFGYTGASSSVEFKNSRIYVKLFPNDNSTFLSSDVMECLKRKIPGSSFAFACSCIYSGFTASLRRPPHPAEWLPFAPFGCPEASNPAPSRLVAMLPVL